MLVAEDLALGPPVDPTPRELDRRGPSQAPRLIDSDAQRDGDRLIAYACADDWRGAMRQITYLRPGHERAEGPARQLDRHSLAIDDEAKDLAQKVELDEHSPHLSPRDQGRANLSPGPDLDQPRAAKGEAVTRD